MARWGTAKKKPVAIQFREVEPNGFFSKNEFGALPFETLDHLEDATYYCRWDIRKAERIETREGNLFGYADEDYVIKGTEGELYPIKKDIFKETYDVVVGLE